MERSNLKFNFLGKNFVITGAGKGIGLSTLIKLHLSGANIAYITRSKSDIIKIKKKISSNRLISFLGDVSNSEDRKNFFMVVKKKFKKLDGLINNAGIRQRIKFSEITSSDLDKVYEINLKSTFFMTQIFLNILKQKKSSIVNISSIVGPRGFIDLSGYAFSKNGIIGLTKSLAAELSKKGIRVNAVSPGFIKSSYENNFKKNLPKLYNYTKKRTPLNRWGDCSEVADLILFLLSNNASYITGNNVFIDGGWSAV